MVSKNIQTYIQSTDLVPGKLRLLLEQDEQYLPLLERFFTEHNYPRIAWIYNLGVGRPDAASAALEQVALQESKLSAKHVG